MFQVENISIDTIYLEEIKKEKKEKKKKEDAATRGVTSSLDHSDRSGQLPGSLLAGLQGPGGLGRFGPWPDGPRPR
jgi:hypothetical protein